jgi:single-strand DNA-binding protein
MANVNKVILIGNLTRDVEVKNLSSGTAVAQIGLAINREWKDKDGEKKEEVTFVDCEAWGKTAEIMAKYLAKGKPVFIEGRLKLDSWEKDGEKRSKIKVVVESFQFLGSGKGSDDAAPAEKPAGGKKFKQPGEEAKGGGGLDPESIPFTWRGIDGF